MKERMRKWKRRRLLLLVLLGEENDDTKYNGKKDSFHIYYIQGRIYRHGLFGTLSKRSCKIQI